MESFRIPVYINPLRLFEWDREPIAAANLPPDPSPERLLQFLCPLGVDSAMPAFKQRYQELNDPQQPYLYFSIEEPGVVDNLFGPLRGALTSYVVGNHVGCIALCGLVAEKLAILRFAANVVDEAQVARFEKADQWRRVKVLKEKGWIEPEMIHDFGTIRAARREYLHHWTQPGSRVGKDAREAYFAAVRLVLKGFGFSFADGALVIETRLIEYLRRHGVVTDEGG